MTRKRFCLLVGLAVIAVAGVGVGVAIVTSSPADRNDAAPAAVTSTRTQ